MSETVNPSQFSIAAAQSSAVKGDLPNNVCRHAELAAIASEHHADVVVFPELSLSGYEPTIAAETAIDSSDPVLDPLQKLSDHLNVTVIAGCPILSPETRPYIGAFIFRPGHAIEIYRKRFLHPGEEPYFISFDDAVVCHSHGREIGIAICADIHNPRHPADASDCGATVYAAGVAMTPNGIGESEDDMSELAKRHRLLAVMANYASTTGGFPMAGKSAIWNEAGEPVARAERKGETLVIAKASPEGWSGSVVAA